MDCDEPLWPLIKYLNRHIGKKAVKYVSDLQKWNSVADIGKSVESEMRLRYAHSALVLVIEAYGAETAKSWLFGSNGYLDDGAPAWVLRHAKSAEDLRAVVAAARSFVRS